jgi:hypothetical protein
MHHAGIALLVILREQDLEDLVERVGFTLRSRNMNGSPAGMSSFTQATPAPSWPRLCCFSISRKSFVNPHSGVPYFPDSRRAA